MESKLVMSEPTYKMFGTGIDFDNGAEVLMIERVSDDQFLGEGYWGGKVVRKLTDFGVVEFIED